MNSAHSPRPASGLIHDSLPSLPRIRSHRTTLAKFRVRFVPDRFTPKQLPQEALKPRKQAPPRRFYRCRYPCRECRQSRSRCDETYPVCLRCSRKGIVCHAAAREQQWQIHLPAFTLISGHHVSSLLHSQSDNKLLQYWLEKTSRILVACDDENPFAYPIIEYLSTGQSMLHIIRSISSAHQHFFHPGQVHDSLEQRVKAIEALRGELGMGSQQLHTLFLSIYLLGISSSFLDHELQDFGHEHLEAARIVIDLILAEEASRKHPLTRLAFGTFVYWDMSCAFLTPTSRNPTQNFEGLLYTFIVEEMTGVLHPTTGPCTELFYILCTLGRYIRHVISGGIQDLDLEILLETKLLNWNLPDPGPSTMWVQTAEAFRKHGLIMLCRFSYAPSLVPWEAWTDTDEQSVLQHIDQLTRQYAVDIMTSLSTIPLTSTYLALQPIPLLTAGAELTVEDSHLRSESKSRLLALYSCSRIPANLVAANLLDRLWQLRMEGGCVTWPELLIQDNMKLRVG